MKQAAEDIRWYQKYNPVMYKKCRTILEAIIQNPRSGIGKPERLLYFKDKEVYSRRLNKKDRIVYTIYETVKEIDIASCKGHYE